MADTISTQPGLQPGQQPGLQSQPGSQPGSQSQIQAPDQAEGATGSSGAEAPHVEVSDSTNVTTSVEAHISQSTSISAPADQSLSTSAGDVTTSTLSSASHDVHNQDLTRRFVNALLPGRGAEVPTSSAPANVSTAPPVVTRVDPNVLSSVPPSGIMSATQAPGYTVPPGYMVPSSYTVPVYTQNVIPSQAQVPLSTQGAASASFGGHSLASPLWNWQSTQPPAGVAPVASYGQFVTSQYPAQFPAQFRPVGTPILANPSVSLVGPNSTVNPSVSFVGAIQAPTVSIQAPSIPLTVAPPSAPNPPGTSITLGANTATSYVYGAPQPHYWGGAQSQVPNVLQPQELPPPWGPLTSFIPASKLHPVDIILTLG